MNYRIATLFSSLALVISFLTFAWYHDWIVFSIPILADTVNTQTVQRTTYKKKMTVFYLNNGKEQQETKEILWSDNLSTNALTLVNVWAALLEEENVVHKKIMSQAASVTFTNDELIISFERSPFNKNDAAHIKLELVETLLKTLHTHMPTLQKVRFLVNHQPLTDYHLDFSQPWLISGFSAAAQQPTPTTAPQHRTIMIDPAGDAQYTGRIIDDVFERSITMRCAHALKQLLEADGTVRVVFTRHPGETVEPLQNAIVTNRLKVDLFMSLHCYQESGTTPHCSLYQFTYQPLADQWRNKTERLAFISLHQAYNDYREQSGYWIQHLSTALQQPAYRSKFITEQPRAFPFKPLLGIHAPAIGIEMGLVKQDDWHGMLEAIVKALQS